MMPSRRVFTGQLDMIQCAAHSVDTKQTRSAYRMLDCCRCQLLIVSTKCASLFQGFISVITPGKNHLSEPIAPNKKCDYVDLTAVRCYCELMMLKGIVAPDPSVCSLIYENLMNNRSTRTSRPITGQLE